MSKIYLTHTFSSGVKHASEKTAMLERVFNIPVKQLSYK